MEKIIKISDKDYKMKASAFTQFAYKNETGRSFIGDIKELAKLDVNNLDDLTADQIDGVIELLLKISYILIKEADSNQVTDYESFLRGINSIYDDREWMNDVILLACSPISGRLHQN